MLTPVPITKSYNDETANTGTKVYYSIDVYLRMHSKEQPENSGFLHFTYRVVNRGVVKIKATASAAMGDSIGCNGRQHRLQWATASAAMGDSIGCNGRQHQLQWATASAAVGDSISCSD